MTLELFKSSKKEKEEKGSLGNKDKVVEGNMVRVKCTKNKVGIVNREVAIEFTYGLGYTIEADVASSAKRLGILEMKGSWVTYKGSTLVQGIDNLVPMLFDNPELLEDLKKEVLIKTSKEDA
jgi:recombination protein RecA